MDEALLKSGQYPNIAIEAGTDPAEVMREHGKVIPDGEKYELDTREQLEADIRATINGQSVWIWPAAECAIRWLDRQAAITEREVKLRELYKFEENHRANIEAAEEVNRKLNGRIAELTAERDRLQERNDRQGETIDRLSAKVDELEAEVEAQRKRANDAERGVLDGRWYVCHDRYEDDIAELTAERDALKKLISQSDAPKSGESAESGTPNDEIRDFDDSREQLEADVREWIDIATYKTFSPERMFEVMLHWLDYQAIITERLMAKNWEETSSQLVFDMNKARAERDKLQSERDMLQGANDFLADGFKGIQAERDQLSRDLDAEHALVVQFEHDNEELRHANNTLRASVAGLKGTVEKLGGA